MYKYSLCEQIKYWRETTSIQVCTKLNNFINKSKTNVENLKLPFFNLKKIVSQKSTGKTKVVINEIK